MDNQTVFTIFNPITGKVVGDTKNLDQVGHINNDYKGVMLALPFDEFLTHCDQLRTDGNRSPFI
jgi:hypothetical protein